MFEHLHAKYLHRLSSNLSHAGLERDAVEFTLVEPDWYDEKNNSHSLCDIIVGLKEGYAIPIELKANLDAKKDKAIKQISGGVRFSNSVLHRPVPYGIIMIYDADKNLYLPPVQIVDELPEQYLPDINSFLDSII